LTFITERKKESDRRGRDETDATHATVLLKANGQLVFEFEVRTTITYATDAPIFDDTMGQIAAFIDGPWVTDIPSLLQKMMSHSRDVRKMRSAPKDAERLKQEMKRFGL
jgi:hypothetical protein